MCNSEVCFGILEKPSKYRAGSPLLGPYKRREGRFHWLGAATQGRAPWSSEGAGQRGRVWPVPSPSPAWPGAPRESPSLLIGVTWKGHCGAGAPEVVLWDSAPQVRALAGGGGGARAKRDSPFWSRREKEKMRSLM